MNHGQVGLAWSDDSDGQDEIYFQRFDRAAMPTEPSRRLTQNRSSSLIPAIRPWRSGFALAWNEYVGGRRSHDDVDGQSEIAVAVVP